MAYLYAEEYHHRRNERPASYDSLDRALEVAERAVRLDSENQASQGALGMTYLLRGDRERGTVAASRAVELNPNNSTWLAALGAWLSVRGDFERGIPLTRALSEMLAQWSGPADGIRPNLIQRNGFAPELVDHLMDGLRKGGLEDSPESPSSGEQPEG